MEGVSKFVKDTLPHYLRTLPIPKTAAGILKLTVDDWKRLSPFLTVTIIFFYLLLRYFLKREDGGSSKQGGGKDKVNLALKKDCDKVVDTCDIEDVLKEKDGKKVYCRCWRSKKFPYCDGSHNKHNETTGDNVGPLIVSSGKKAN